MQGRSWMAALALAAGVALALVGRPAPTRAGDVEPVVNKVALTLRITGVGKDGCEIEVKPGHAACEFEPVTKKITELRQGQAQITLDLAKVRSTSPDRDCQFSITIKEPNQPPRVVRRGIRLVAPAAGVALPEQTFVCYLRSPSLAAKDEAERRLR